MTSSSRWPPRLPVRVVIAVGLALLGVVLIWTAWARPGGSDAARAGAPPESSGPGSSAPAASSSKPRVTPDEPSAPEREGDLQDKTKGLVLPESDPVVVSIPRIGVSSRLVDLDLDDDGSMQVPEPADAGWFTRGATPGALGPAVIAGHVTWDGAPAIFHRLGTLKSGDRVTVSRKDGRTAVFRVDRVARFAKSQFPSQAVYGPIDHAGLRLITCGGTYDAARNRYLDNVIVFARLESVRPDG